MLWRPFIRQAIRATLTIFPLRTALTKEKAEIARKVFVDPPKEEKPADQPPVSFRLLADILGKKYYQHNEEVKYEDEAIVRIYDVNNRLIGEMSFSRARDMALKENLDLVLKTRSTTVPVIQIAPYRAELIKKFYEKYTHLKSAGSFYSNHLLEEESVEDKDFTITEIKQQIDMSDLRTKVASITNMVQKKKDAVKVIVKVNPLNKIEVAKANFLLQNVADQLIGIGIIRRKTAVQEFPEIPMATVSREEAKEEVEDQEVRIAREMEPADDIVIQDLPKRKKRAKELKDNVHLGYVSVEIIPQTNKVPASTIEGILTRLGSVEGLLKRVQERKVKYSIGYICHRKDVGEEDEDLHKRAEDIVKEAKARAMQSVESSLYKKEAYLLEAKMHRRSRASCMTFNLKRNSCITYRKRCGERRGKMIVSSLERWILL